MFNLTKKSQYQGGANIGTFSWLPDFKKDVLWLVRIVWGSILLSGCGVLSEGHSPMAYKKTFDVTLTETDNGQLIAVPLGANLVLRLKETPGTGFRWAVDTGDQDILKLRRSDYIPAEDSAVGGGGQRVLVFEAKRSGSVRLLLKLKRAWEGDKSVASRFEVKINVLADWSR